MMINTLSKWGRQRQRREANKIVLRNPRIILSISLLWLPCMFLFSLKLLWLQHLLNETMDVSSWNVGHVSKTARRWSSSSLIWEQDGTNETSTAPFPRCLQNAADISGIKVRGFVQEETLESTEFKRKQKYTLQGNQIKYILCKIPGFRRIFFSCVPTLALALPSSFA